MESSAEAQVAPIHVHRAFTFWAFAVRRVKAACELPRTRIRSRNEPLAGHRFGSAARRIRRGQDAMVE